MLFNLLIFSNILDIVFFIFFGYNMLFKYKNKGSFNPEIWLKRSIVILSVGYYVFKVIY